MRVDFAYWTILTFRKLRRLETATSMHISLASEWADEQTHLTLVVVIVHAVFNYNSPARVLTCAFLKKMNQGVGR